MCNSTSHFPYSASSSSSFALHYLWEFPQWCSAYQFLGFLILCNDGGHTKLWGPGENLKCLKISMIANEGGVCSLACFFVRNHMVFVLSTSFCHFFPPLLFPGSPNSTGRQTNETPQTQEEEDLQITGATPPMCNVY